MSIDPQCPIDHEPRERGKNSPLVCAACGTDGSLALHSIIALTPPAEGEVEVGYACTGCNLHYLHRADVVAVAAVLNRASYTEDVLVFGGHYIHCGQPMQALGSQISRLHAAAYTDGAREDAVDVNLETRVLRCSCGFQVELPDEVAEVAP
jgi:predicted aconitase